MVLLNNSPDVIISSRQGCIFIKKQPLSTGKMLNSIKEAMGSNPLSPLKFKPQA